MSASPLTAILLFLSLIGALGGDKHDSRSATTLTSSTFDDYLEKQRATKRPALIMFHVGWCKACQRTFPLFAAASDEVKEQEVPMDFAHADCTDDKSLCQRFDVAGYPTIKLFPPEEGKAPQSFRGVRTEAGFVKYAKRMTKPPIQSFESWPAFEKALSDESFSGIIIEDRQANDLHGVATRWMDRHVIASASKLSDLLPEELHSQVPDGAYVAVLAPSRLQWKGFQKEALHAVTFYKDVFDTIAIDNWIEKSRFPGVWQLGEWNFFEFSHADHPAVMVASTAKVSLELDEQVRGAQQALQSDYLFGVVNGEDWSKELLNLGIYQEELPRALVIEKNFEEWVEDIQELRMSHLQEDLQKLVAGAPLLRQGRTMLHKIFVYKRQAWRGVLEIWGKAQKANYPNLMSGCLIGAVIMLVLCFAALIWQCCAFMMLEDEPDFSHARKEQAKKKNN